MESRTARENPRELGGTRPGSRGRWLGLVAAAVLAAGALGAALFARETRRTSAELRALEAEVAESRRAAHEQAIVLRELRGRPREPVASLPPAAAAAPTSPGEAPAELIRQQEELEPEEADALNAAANTERAAVYERTYASEER